MVNKSARFGLALASVMTLTAAAAAPSLAQAPPPETISPATPSLPNHFLIRDAQGNPSSARQDLSQSLGTVGFADPANGLVFTYNSSASDCVSTQQRYKHNIAAFDTDSFALIQAKCAPWLREDGNPAVDHRPMNPGQGPFVAVDSADRLLFFVSKPGKCTGNAVLQFTRARIVVVSEETLDVVAVWDLPDEGSRGPATGGNTDALPCVGGLSWDSERNQLLVLTGNGADGASETVYLPGARVTAYDISTGLKRQTKGPQDSFARLTGGGLKEAELWTRNVERCVQPLQGFYYGGHPRRGPHGIYVPCVIEAFPSDHPFSQRDRRHGVVKMPVAADGAPTGEESVAPAPERTVDFLFDPLSERGFMPTAPTGSAAGTSVLVYDGRLGRFIGRTQIDIGASNPGLAFDERTGRLYAWSTIGVTVVDGRKTPISPGARYTMAQLGLDLSGQPTGAMTLPVIPPTESHPYPRVIANFQHQTSISNYLPYFTVLADTLTVAGDPPPADLDAGTYTGPLPPGGELAVTYGGTARAYGFHSNLVGGVHTTLNNLSLSSAVGDQLLRVSPGSRNLYGAYVGELKASETSRQARATALSDASGTTSGDYSRCTNAQSASTCVWPEVRPLGCKLLGQDIENCPLPFPVDTSKGPKTAQLWPYPDADCVTPEAAGFFYTRWDERKDQNGNPLPKVHPVPGSERSAWARVNCTEAGGSANGRAYLQGVGSSNQGLPTVYVGSAESTAFVEPVAKAPTEGGQLVSRAIAQARNIRIDLGDHYLTIGEIFQKASARSTGRTETGAKAEREVIIRHLEFDGQDLCSTDCEKELKQVADEINSHFAAPRIEIVQPEPDPVLLDGSPGGYTSAVQSQSLFRAQERQFHGASEQESFFLPGLRIVIYNDGSFGVNRLILDFAGVYLESNMGVELLPEPPVASLKISLTDDSDPVKPLAGGIFELYQDVAADGILDELTDSLVQLPDGKTAACTSGEDGSGNCEFALAAGSYIVHQVKAPPGYFASPDFPTNPPTGECPDLTVKAGSGNCVFTVEPGLAYEVKVVNPEATGAVHLRLTDDSDPPKPLAGGRFKLIYDEDGDRAIDEKDTPFAVCTINEAGICPLKLLPESSSSVTADDRLYSDGKDSTQAGSLVDLTVTCPEGVENEEQGLAEGECGYEIPLGSYIVVQTAAPPEYVPAPQETFTLGKPKAFAKLHFINGLEPIPGTPPTPGSEIPAQTTSGGTQTTVIVEEAPAAPRPVATAEPMAPKEGIGEKILRIIRVPAEGLRLLVRNPKEGILVASVLLLLFAPLWIAWRRGMWLRTVQG